MAAGGWKKAKDVTKPVFGENAVARESCKLSAVSRPALPVFAGVRRILSRVATAALRLP
jgi:hypothetical protein